MLDRQYAVFDLDGTLANITHRVDHIMKQPKDWESFHSETMGDMPIRPTILLAKALKSQGLHIVVLTGRNMIARRDTIKWLNRFTVPFDALLMRPEHDYSPDTKLKPLLASSFGLTPENTLFIFEDRGRMVDTWRDLGFLCFQVAEGNY